MKQAVVVLLALAAVATFIFLKRQRAEVDIQAEAPAWPDQVAAEGTNEELVPSSTNNGN